MELQLKRVAAGRPVQGVSARDPQLRAAGRHAGGDILCHVSHTFDVDVLYQG